MRTQVFLLAVLAGAVLGGTTQAQPDEVKAQIPRQIERLEKGTPAQRLEAVRFLGDLGPAAKAAIPQLRRRLKEDADAEVRSAAGLALAFVSHGPDRPAAVMDLAQALKDAESEVRSSAALALGILKEDAKDALPQLIATLRDVFRDPNSVGWFEAATAIMKIEEQNTTVPVLVAEKLKNQTEALGGARNFLVRLGSRAQPSVPTLIDVLRDHENFWMGRCGQAIDVLGSIGPPAKEAVPELLKLLEVREDDLRFRSALALTRIDPQQEAGVSVLLAELGNRDVRGRAEGAVWLAKRATLVLWDGKTLRRAISGGLRGMQQTAYANRSRRVTAVQALGEMGPAGRDAVPALTEALKDPTPAVREAAAKALNKIQGAPPAPLSPSPARAPEKEE